MEDRRAADNKRFGNRLAEGITIGCSSLSAVVPADFYGLKKYNFVFLFTGETGVFHKRFIIPNYCKCP